MALGATLFAAMNLLAKVASRDAPWALVAAVRAGVGAVVALGVARARGSSLRGSDRFGMWLRSGLGTAALLFTFGALGSPALPLGDAATLLNLSPVLIAILAPLVLREPLERRILLALPLCAAGVVLLLRPAFVFGGGAPRTSAAYLASALAIAAATFSACAMMALRRMSQRESPEAIAFHFSAVAAVASALVAAPSLRVFPLRAVGPMLGAGLCAGFAQLAMTRAYSIEKASRVAGVGYWSVVASTLFGVVFLHEHPGPTALAGSALIVSGGLIVALAGLRGRITDRDGMRP